MWSYNGMGWGGWIVISLTLLAFCSLVVYAVVAIFRGDREARHDQALRERDPERILEERFARGEIEADEYHARQDALRAPR